MAAGAFLFSLFPTKHETHKQCDITAKNPEFQMGPQLEEEKKKTSPPQIQPEIWIKNLILNTGGSDLSRCGVWLLAIALFLIALFFLFPRFLSLSRARSLKFWTAVSHCEKGGKVALILPIMPQSVHLLWWSD